MGINKKANWFLAGCLIFFTACAHQDYYRTQILQTPCRSETGQDCSTASLTENKFKNILAFVEFADDGQYQDDRQATSLFNWLKQVDQPLYVVLFVHGWNHNAKENDFNVRRFRESLDQLKQLHLDYQVVGVYLGWQGVAMEAPGIRLLSYWNRKNVSEQLAEGQLTEFLQQIEHIVNADDKPENRLLTIGHSLGALTVFSALEPVLLERQANQSKQGFGDLLVLVNPAFETQRFENFQNVWQTNAERQQLSIAKPALIVASSEADGMIANLFPITRWFPAGLDAVGTVLNDHGWPDEQNWQYTTTALGHITDTLTHRLEMLSNLESPSCLPVVAESTQDFFAQSQVKYQVAQGLELSALNNQNKHQGIWLVQTDRNVLPNHGFLGQKQFWCFMDRILDMGKSKF